MEGMEGNANTGLEGLVLWYGLVRLLFWACRKREGKVGVWGMWCTSRSLFSLVLVRRRRRDGHCNVWRERTASWTVQVTITHDQSDTKPPKLFNNSDVVQARPGLDWCRKFLEILENDNDWRCVWRFRHHLGTAYVKLCILGVLHVILKQTARLGPT